MRERKGDSIVDPLRVSPRATGAPSRQVLNRNQRRDGSTYHPNRTNQHGPFHGPQPWELKCSFSELKRRPLNYSRGWRIHSLRGWRVITRAHTGGKYSRRRLHVVQAHGRRRCRRHLQVHGVSRTRVHDQGGSNSIATRVKATVAANLGRQTVQ
jgi:hypothetical protein